MGKEYDDEYFEWEERDESTPFWKHMVAGSVAGIMEHISMLPIDTLKTHSQSSIERISVRQSINHIYSSAGLLGFWKGSSVMAMGCVPSHSLYFSIYEYSRSSMGLNDSEDVVFSSNALIGVFSTAFHDLIMNPCEGRVHSC